jgi:hypothetical protein
VPFRSMGFYADVSHKLKNTFVYATYFAPATTRQGFGECAEFGRSLQHVDVNIQYIKAMTAYILVGK